MATAMNEKREESVHTSAKDLCGDAPPILLGPVLEPCCIYDCTRTVSKMKIEPWTMMQQEKEKHFIFDHYLYLQS